MIDVSLELLVIGRILEVLFGMLHCFSTTVVTGGGGRPCEAGWRLHGYGVLMEHEQQ